MRDTITDHHHRPDRPRRHRRVLVSILLTAAIGVAASATSAPAVAAPVAALTDFTSIGFGTVVVDSSACLPDGSGTFTFTATSDATGSFPGTLTETGTVVFGPAQQQPSYTPVLAYSSTFEIVGPAGTVNGTTQLLEPTTGFFGSQTLNQGWCIEGGNREVQVETTYAATITLPDGTEVSDVGVGRVFAGVGRSVSPSNVTTLDLESTAGYPSPDPGLVTVRAEGVVEYVDGVAVELGDPYVLEYTFEQSTPASYRTRTFASFPAITSMTLTLGGSTVTSSTGTIAVSTGSDEYRVDAYQSLTESGGPLGPTAPNQVFLQMGGSDLVTELGIPLDPTVLAASTRYVAITYRDLSCPPFFSGCPDGVVQMTVDRLTLVPAGPDADGDGVADDIAALDGNGDPIAGSFVEADGTSGSIVSGTGVLVEDAPTPDGVRVTTTSEPVTLQVCGGFTVRLGPGSDVTLTCGSVTVEVASGEAVVDLGTTGSVTVPTGGVATVDRTTRGDYVVTNDSTTAVTVVRGGVTTSLAGGATTSSVPQTRSDCTRNGWRAYGRYVDQGSCIKFVRAKR